MSVFDGRPLQVNGQRLLGLNHVEVVAILKELPQHVRVVVARRRAATSPADLQYAQTRQAFFTTPTAPSAQSPAGGVVSSSTTISSDRLVKAKSEQALPVTALTAETSLNKMKSRSLEPLTSLAMWSSEPVVIELTKGDRGLGFSILDYQVRQTSGQTTEFILIFK